MTEETPSGGTGTSVTDADGAGVDAGSQSTYELLQSRLENAAAELASRADALNQLRLEAFSSSDLELVGTERVRTENNVVPRDIAAAGNQLVLAYNAVAGVRSEVRPEDVFSIHHLDESSDRLVLSANPDGLADSPLDDDQFRRDFEELHTYFKDARIQQVYQVGQKLLAVFRTGDGVNDLRVLRWSVHPDGRLTYLDDRGERDHRFPAHQDVEWIPTTRSDHAENRFIVIGERILVNPLDGSLQISLVDGTTDGATLLQDSVDHSDQALQDCEVDYAVAGDLIIVRVLPYRETTRRHYVVNLIARTAIRVDALDQAFRQLPENQGLIFPEGIYLRTGEVRRFDLDASEMELLEVVRSPNGEDVLYVFHHKDDGRSILLPYNMVRQEVALPIWCHGHGLFEDGRMVIFREEPDPTRVHPMQLWDTPFCSDEWYSEQPHHAGPLDRIGNASLVAGIADALALQRLVTSLEPSSELYGDLLGSAGRTLDAHHWFNASEVGDLATPIRDIRAIAEQVIDEFEQVQEVRKAAAKSVSDAAKDLENVQHELRIKPPTDTEGFIERLGGLRAVIGHLHTVSDGREVDTEAVDQLIESATESRQALAQDAAEYLAQDDAFVSYLEQLEAISGRTDSATASVEVSEILGDIEHVADAMDTVADTVGDLVVDDPRIRTSVLEQVSGVLAGLNRIRAEAQGRLDDLILNETKASFATELGLFSQTISTTLARSTTPEACDDGLARLLLQLEHIETSGQRSESQLDELNERRDHLVEAFTARRQQLLDASQKRSDRLMAAADRTLQRLADRSAQLSSIDELNGFFAADPLIDRVRRNVEQLRELDEPLRADELASRLSSARDSAVRSLRDRLELFDRGAVKLGKHRFNVDERSRELTLVPMDDHLEAVLTGTDLRLPIDDESLTEHQDLWDQPVISETPELYRGAYLAASIILKGLDGDPEVRQIVAGSNEAQEGDDAVLRYVSDQVNERLDEGYDRGVHDLDAAQVLRRVGSLAMAAETLIYPGSVRAQARWVWAMEVDERQKGIWQQRGRAARLVRSAPLDATHSDRDLLRDLAHGLAEDFELGDDAAQYLVAELSAEGEMSFALSEPVAEKLQALESTTTIQQIRDEFSGDPTGMRSIIADFVEGELGSEGISPHVVDELVASLLLSDQPTRTCSVDLSFDVPDLAGQHATIEARTLSGRVDVLLHQARQHRDRVVPRQRDFLAKRRACLSGLRSDLRLGDIEPQVPEGFVRNQLIDKLYLPLIGDNLARQIGTADDHGAARSGLLLLLSPPGYGKTTLVEYLADRLGMALVKVSGPALGHDVTTLDPAQAPSATAAREIERINLSFAIGSNVILYVDDIQHTSPELLQRFISLCDGQRRIDGVWGDEAQTFDLRGKRFAVVMAGNPYTESGQRFKIPDMLANRADTYNLGDVLSGSEEVFASSYIENALTANPVLAPLAARDRRDIGVFLAAAQGRPLNESALQHTYSAAEQREIVQTLRHLQQVQRVVLKVNRQYIASAATEDAYRSEPSFLLQGSYRNMARMTSKLLPVMTESEIDEIIDEHYVAESQALTGAAEANLLKLAELRETITDEQQQRWDEIVATFARQQRLGGDERDPATRVVAAISEIAAELESIRTGVPD